jgi:hypothetical protein
LPRSRIQEDDQDAHDANDPGQRDDNERHSASLLFFQARGLAPQRAENEARTRQLLETEVTI